MLRLCPPYPRSPRCTKLNSNRAASASHGRTSMKRLYRLLVLSFIIFLPLPSAAQQATTLYEGARLIVGDGSAPIENSAFLVVGNRIAQVGRKGEIAAPAGAARVDLSGKTVIPGIVDAHGHPGFLDMVTGTMSKDNFTRENYIDHLQRYAYHGVVAVISTGTDFGDL